MVKASKKKSTKKNPTKKQKNSRKSSGKFFSRIKQRPGLAIGTGFIILGLLMGGFTLFNTWLSQRTVGATSSQALQSNSKVNDVLRISGKPVRIQLPSVGIDLKVIPGYYYKATGSWTLSLNDAQWGVMTAEPNNQGGATFIYAHYRWHVFYTLPKVETGAKAIVTTANGHKFTYIFRSSTIIGPNNTRLFAYRGKPILVLQTCTGVHFQNRQLFVFDFKKVV